MKKVFGRPAIDVPQPDGTLAGYLIEGATPPDPRVSREWKITSPKGDTYTVREYPTHWRCTCPAFTRFTRHGCVHRVGRQMGCKHIRGLAEELGAGHGGPNDRRPGQGLAGHGGPDAPAPPLGEHDPA